MNHIHLEHLSLTNFRNLSQLSLNLSSGVNLLVGSNGAGKTSILESISLLSPGKGLRSANFDDICKYGEKLWEAKFKIQSKLGIAEIITTFQNEPKSRKISYNGAKISSTELANFLNIIWVTPQMEGIFTATPSVRRRFIDRIVYNFVPHHAKNLAKYEHYVRERNKALAQGINSSNASWLDLIEEKIAQEAVIIDKDRRKVIASMQQSIDSLGTDFPKANLELSGLFKEKIDEADILSLYTKELLTNRTKDSYAGRTTFGVHTSDFIVKLRDKDRAARFCSTGEQKALLISIILSSIESILKATDFLPVLLLDELFVHLDEKRKEQLSDYITSTKLQTLITTTDIMGIEDLALKSNIIKL